MAEIEVPLEKIQEDIHHHARHYGEGGHGGDGSDSSMEAFVNRGAILSALLAVLAAISALIAGHFANDAMIEQIKSSDSWAYFQAKSIKKSIAELKGDDKKIEGYEQEKEKIKEEAEHKEKESEHHLLQHESMATAVTFFQVAIAMVAISVLSKKRLFMYFSAGLGLMGIGWMIKTLFL